MSEEQQGQAGEQSIDLSNPRALDLQTLEKGLEQAEAKQAEANSEGQIGVKGGDDAGREQNADPIFERIASLERTLQNKLANFEKELGTHRRTQSALDKLPGTLKEKIEEVLAEREKRHLQAQLTPEEKLALLEQERLAKLQRESLERLVNEKVQNLIAQRDQERQGVERYLGELKAAAGEDFATYEPHLKVLVDSMTRALESDDEAVREKALQAYDYYTKNSGMLLWRAAQMAKAQGDGQKANGHVGQVQQQRQAKASSASPQVRGSGSSAPFKKSIADYKPNDFRRMDMKSLEKLLDEAEAATTN